MDTKDRSKSTSRASGSDNRRRFPLPRRHAPPIATYRLQLNKDFDFSATLRALPYLAQLGVSHLYVSPFTKSPPGSTHGYDVADHTALNPEIGDDAALVALSDALAAHDMGMILDFVPNHMGLGNDNAWWLDVLEWGPTSPYARFFDIDWSPNKRELSGKVLAPILGAHYGVTLERSELTLRFSPGDGSFSVWYFDNRLPVRPLHYATIIRRALTDTPCGPKLRARLRLLADGFARLRPGGLSRRLQMEMRAHYAHLKGGLVELAQTPDAAAWLERAAESFNGTPGQSRSFRLLHALLERQYYRLAFWRVAANEINYRRFFDINSLIGIRQEEPEVFRHTHRLVGELVAQDQIQGVRIDHIDGLYDPAGYCRNLRQLVESRRVASGADIGRRSAQACFPIYVEKILRRHEALRTEWPVDGTTGYDFLALLNRLFIHPNAVKLADAAFRNFAGDVPSFEVVLYDSKRLVMDTLLASELDVLARALDRIAEQNWRTRDYTFERLRRAIVETVAHFSVYRTYVIASGCSAEDHRIVDMAINRAKQHWLGPDREILDFLQMALTLNLIKDRRPGYSRTDVVQFAMRFQQFCSPVMAKGLEDTAGYRYPRFLSLNEVGSEPDLHHLPVGGFHAANEERRQHWPNAMLATATHDTKRGEDVRARLNVLSELDEWGTIVRRWRRFNRRWRTETDGQRIPSLADEYMIYQTLVGAWPPQLIEAGEGHSDDLVQFRERMKNFLTKAVREAKLVSSWSIPNEAYEQGCHNFIDAALNDLGQNLFMDDLRRLVRRIAFLGALNGLSQLVLKCTSPGIPDIYQGNELWDLNLVDPDNRRAVDFGMRASILHDIFNASNKRQRSRPDFVPRLMHNWPNGEIKLYVLWRLLMLRNSVPQLFREGSYEPLRIAGERAEHVIAFLRRDSQSTAIIAVGRWFDTLLRQDAREYSDSDMWLDTTVHLDGLATTPLFDLFSHRRIDCDLVADTLSAKKIFSTLPVVVLTSVPSDS